MLYSYNEVIGIFGNDYNLKKALGKKEIFKLDKGIYSKKYPNAVITMDSAYYYYNLTDVIPNKVWLVTDRNTDKIKNDKIAQTFMSKEILYIGKVEIKTKEGIINIYDKERLLVELIRKKNQIPLDYYKV